VNRDTRAKLGIASLVLAVALGSGSLHAQAPPPAPMPSPPATPPGPSVPPPGPSAPADQVTPKGNQLLGPKAAALPPSEMLKAANQLLEELREMLKGVVTLQEMARKQKDVIKLNCINDKLIQLKQLMNLIESNVTFLHEAVAQEDEGLRQSLFSRLADFEIQIRLLVSEAETCIGEELVFLGGDVIVEEPDLVDDPTVDVPNGEIEAPNYASPFF
jgi:hypothetical protein